MVKSYCNEQMFITFVVEIETMPRPKRQRRMERPPGIKGFRPHGGKRKQQVVELHYEEYEAIKLADYDGLSQEEASRKMDVSRPTFTRIYDKALKKIAKAFVEHREIVIEGGEVIFADDWFRCKSCDYVFRMPEKEKQIDQCAICGSGQIIDEPSFMKEKTSRISDVTSDSVKPATPAKQRYGNPFRDSKCPECNQQINKQNPVK